MNNQSIFRYGGVAAVASAVLYVLSLVLAFTGSGAGTALYILSSLLMVFVLAVLYMDLRTEAPLPALLALILLGGLTIWSMFLNPAEISPVFGPLTLGYGLGFILFGWLQRRNSRHPKGIGFLAIATGVVAVIAAAALMAGASADVFGLLNLVVSIPYLIWSVWLGMYYLKGQVLGLQSA